MGIITSANVATAIVKLVAADALPALLATLDQPLLLICFPVPRPSQMKMAELKGELEKLGYILPEYFPYWFCDHWIDDLGHMTGRIVYTDVRSDQRKVGVTQELREPGWWGTWFDAAVQMRRQEAMGLIDHISEDVLHKAMLRTKHIWVEYRSKWINDNVRAQARGLESMAQNSLKDERYLRVKDKAIAMIPKMLEGMDAQMAKMFHDQLIVPDKILSFPRAFG